jgi:hypothetical protein
MDLLLQPVVELYRHALRPLAPFTWFGIPLSALDVAAAFRLCVVMRQLKESARADHETKRLRARRALKGKEKARASGMWEPEVEEEIIAPPEERSFVRDAASTLLVVYGGEIMSGMSTVTCIRTYMRGSPVDPVLASAPPRDPALVHALGHCPRLLHPYAGPRRAPSLCPVDVSHNRVPHLFLRRSLACLSPLQPHPARRRLPHIASRVDEPVDTPHYLSRAFLLPMSQSSHAL